MGWWKANKWLKMNGKIEEESDLKSTKKRRTEFVSVHTWVCEAELWKFLPLTVKKMAFTNNNNPRIPFQWEEEEWKEKKRKEKKGSEFCMQAKDFQIAFYFVALDGIH